MTTQVLLPDELLYLVGGLGNQASDLIMGCPFNCQISLFFE